MRGFLLPLLLMTVSVAPADETRPVPASLEKMARGEYANDTDLCVEGVVMDVFVDQIDKRWEYVVLNCDGTPLYILRNIDRRCPVNFKNLIGARISAVGCYHYRERGERKLLGYNLELPNDPKITVLTPAKIDLFDAPQLSNITSARDTETTLIRHRAEGQVIATRQNGLILLQTHTNGIVNVNLATSHLPSVGEIIEVVGFPTTDLFRINLVRAEWKHKAQANIPITPPFEITAENLLTDGHGHHQININHHGHAITVTGKIRSLPTAGNNDGIFYLECGDFTIPIDASSCATILNNIEIGSVLKITGVCYMQTARWQPNDPLPHIESLMIILRSPTDIEVLSRPSWWTPTRLLSVIGILLAALASTIFWNISLQRIAERRSQDLLSEKIGRIGTELKVQERTRLAVELHDTLAQNLTGVSMEIETADQLSDDHVQMSRHLHTAACTLQSCRDELRNCLWDLRSRALEEPNMNDAIRKTLAPLLTDATLSIRFNVPRSRISDNTAHALMRIIRELVSNAIRHGHAQNIRVAGSIDNGRLLFSVRDDGCGFDPDNRPGILQGHFGLRGIQERVNQFNGKMVLESKPGQGTRISISLNLPQDGQKI